MGKTEEDFQHAVSSLVVTDMFLKNCAEVDTPLMLCRPVDCRPSSAGSLMATAEQADLRKKEQKT